MKHVHIVGFGIAGALVTHELQQRGVAVTATDILNPNSSSLVAAGMITPITGKRLKPTWRGPELMSLAHSVYNSIAGDSTKQVWKNWSLRRVFREPQMHEWFTQRHQRGEFDYWDVQELCPGVHDGVQYPHGGCMHEGVATVNLSEVISIMRSRVQLQQEVDPGAEAVVWCTGYQALYDARWSWLPIEPSKGEILDVRIPGLLLDHVLTNGTWILPTPDADGVQRDGYRIGATHDWDDHDPTPTDAARVYLLEQAQSMVSNNIIVTGHRAAIRPSTQFKRPLAGRHPEHRDQYVFTGLGTKGALQGPWAARQLVEHMLDGKTLDQEIDIMRWWGKER